MSPESSLDISLEMSPFKLEEKIKNLMIINKNGKKNQFSCIECNKTFSEKQKLRTHKRRTHKTEDEYKICPWDGCHQKHKHKLVEV